MFLTDAAPCYDRSVQPQTAVVDAHLHFRPFGGPAIPFEEMASYLEETGVLFANIYGIGQMLPPASSCTYYLDCPGTPVTPTLKNDFVNAANYITNAPTGVHLTLSLTFPDLSQPESILPEMQLLEEEYPDAFKWMGEVNLVKQAMFGNGREPVPMAALTEWAAFMEALQERDIPLAIHADLGNDQDPIRYLPLMQEVLRLYSVVAWIGAEMEFALSQAVASGDTFEHRPSECGHCVQDFLADLDLRDLPGEAAGSESGADDALPPADLRFYPAALVVPCGHLPGHAAVATDLGNMAIPNGWTPRRLRSDHCVLWRRYNHIQGLPIPFPQQIPCRRPIIGAVRQKARDRAIELIQEPG